MSSEPANPFLFGVSIRSSSWTAVDDLSTAVFEETLQCQNLASVISAVKSCNPSSTISGKWK